MGTKGVIHPHPIVFGVRRPNIVAGLRLKVGVRSLHSIRFVTNNYCGDLTFARIIRRLRGAKAWLLCCMYARHGTCNYRDVTKRRTSAVLDGAVARQYQWSFRKTGTIETLASQAEIDVWVSSTGGASVGSGSITPGKNWDCTCICRIAKSSAFGRPYCVLKHLNNGNVVPLEMTPGQYLSSSYDGSC